MVGRGASLLVVAVLAGCESSTEPPRCIEPVAVDPAGTHTIWVVDSVQMPVNAAEANQLGLDLDCDPQDRPDNAFGQILSSIMSLWTDDVNGDVAAMIAEGRLLHLLDLQTTSPVDAAGAGLTVLHGLDLDGDPTDNFDGAEPFGIDTSRGRGMVAGSILDRHLSARGGQLPIAFGLPSLQDVIILPIEGSAIEADVGQGSLTGRIAGGIPAEAVDVILIPVFEYALGGLVTRDCTGTTGSPPCGCIAGSTGETMLEWFDEQPERPGTEPDGDCVITADELRDNSLVRSLLAPDVDFFDAEGELNLRSDGVKDCLSIGIGFTAVPALVEGIQP